MLKVTRQSVGYNTQYASGGGHCHESGELRARLLPGWPSQVVHTWCTSLSREPKHPSRETAVRWWLSRLVVTELPLRETPICREYLSVCQRRHRCHESGELRARPLPGWPSQVTHTWCTSLPREPRHPSREAVVQRYHSRLLVTELPLRKTQICRLQYSVCQWRRSTAPDGPRR